MRYFDNQYLAQYLNQGMDLMVFVDSQYLNISDMSDLADPVEGVGYDSQGRMNKFNYKNIEVVKSGPYYVDIATLTNQLDNYENPEAASKVEPEKKDAKPKDAPADEPPLGDEPPPGDEDPLAEHKFMRRSHSLEEKVDYWPMIKNKPNVDMNTNSLASIKEGEYKGLVGLILESTATHTTLRATNQGDSWTWGSTVSVLSEEVSVLK